MGTGELQDKLFFVVDRIDDDVAICESLENKQRKVVLLSNLSFTIHEGDVVSLYENKFNLEKEKTEERKKYMASLLQSLTE